MRRKINSIFLTGLAAALVLTSCGLAEDAESTDTAEAVEATEQSSQETETTAASQKETAPEYTIEENSQEASDQDLFSYSCQKVTITDDQHEALKEAVSSYYDTLSTDGFEAFKEANQEDAQSLKDQGERELNYSYGIYTDVERCDSQVLALKVTVMEYTAGAHPNHLFNTVNFDVTTGEQIDITDLGNISDQAKEYILNQLSESEEYTQGLFPEYEQTITNDFDDLYQDFAFILNARGVEFIFQEYDIAPYAAGQVSFTVPYSQLDSLDTDYLPKDSFYSFAFTENLHEKVDLNNDGSLEELYFTTTYPTDNTIESTVYVDGQSVTPSDAANATFGQVYFAHATSGNYIFQDLTLDDGSHVTYLYEVTDGINQIGKEDGRGVVSIADGTVELGVYDNETYDWTDVKTYSYNTDENGFKEVETAE